LGVHVNELRIYSSVDDLITALKTNDDNDAPEPGPDLVILTRNHPDLEVEPDDGLVTYMGLQDEDVDLSQRACEQLHHRHAHFLLAWCYKKRYQTFGESAEDFVNETFLRAYRQAKRFVCTDLSQAREQVLAWLFRILRNVFIDSLRSELRRPAIRNQEGTDDWLHDILVEDDFEAGERCVSGGVDGVQDAAVSAQRKTLVLKFRETLKPAEQEIFDLTAQFWSSAQGQTEIDDDIRDGICEKLGISKCSLRVYRKRLLDRLKAFILKHETNTIIPLTDHEKRAESQ
jgi:RNA polymerase sigma factor (sigma-70 family)